jgi:glycosyltransferase involved in cell wall biosynthesis
MPARYRDKCVYVPENAVDPARFGNIRTRRAESPLRAIFVGRLVPYKGADMLIEAAAPLMREGKMTLEIVGEGPQLDQLRNLVEREHLNGSVQFPGLVQQDQLQHRLCNADLFTFPSIREFGGAVVLEAMAVGLVPVVIDYGGPAELVTDRTGFRICLGPRSQVISDLRALLSRLCDDPAEVDSRSEAARNRVSESFTWDAKSHQVIDVYDWATGHATKPNFGMPLPDAESPASKPRNLRATERAAETANV